MANYYATIFFQGDGSTRSFTFPFTYLSKDHVFASINGVAVTFTWTNDNTVFTDAAPAATDVLRVYRVTPVATENVTFANATTLLSDDLNGASLQLLYACQEFADTLSVQKLEEQQDIAKATAAILANTAAITAEIAARTNTDTAESATRAQADTAEAQARAGGDAALQAGINAEVQARVADIATLRAAIDLIGKVTAGTGVSATDIQNIVKTTVNSMFANLPTSPPTDGSSVVYLNGGLVMVAK